MNCEYCLQPFIPVVANQLYCSKKCSNNKRMKAWKKKSRKPCKCGSLMAWNSELCRKCSRSIQTLSKGEALTTDTQRYRRIRSNARIVAKAEGLLEKCVVCGYSLYVECAHVKSVESFSAESLVSEINHPKNLVGLCKNHHWEYDQGILILPGCACL